MTETYLKKYFKEMTNNRIPNSLELADLFRSYFKNVNFNYPLVSDAYWFNIYWACHAFNEIGRAFNVRMELIVYEDRDLSKYETKTGGHIGALNYHVIVDGSEKHPLFEKYIKKVLHCLSPDGSMEDIYNGSVFPKNFYASDPPGFSNDLGFYDRYKSITGKSDEELKSGSRFHVDPSLGDEKFNDIDYESDFNFDDSDIDDLFQDMRAEGSQYDMFDTTTNYEPAPWEKREPNNKDFLSAREKMAEAIKSKMDKEK